MQLATDIQARLKAIVGEGNVDHGDAIGERYRRDLMRKYTGAPALLVKPGTTEEVSAVLKLASAHGLPVTPIGGHTGTSGAAIATEGGLMLSLERMNRIEEIDPASMTITVQAGCVLQVVQEAVEEKGAFLPLDLGSRGSAMIGGVIGSNAGGNRVLRWGMTRDMVIGLEVVLADGTIVSSLTKMIKDNAGYNWKHLLIGSEGTLGVTTRAVLRLRPLPTTHQTALVATDSFDKVVRLLRRVEVALSGRLSSFELMWDDFYGYLTEVQLASRPRPMPTGHAFYVLLEALGGDAETDADQFERVLSEEIEAGVIEDAVIAQSERERQALWAVREDMMAAIDGMRPFVGYDVSMPIADMPRFVAATRRGIESAFPAARMIFYGHAGDGNLHIIVTAGDPENEHAETIDTLVYRAVKDVGGSIAAEHGIGLSRTSFLSMTRSDAEIMLMNRIKHALDPNHILNPGKVLG